MDAARTISGTRVVENRRTTALKRQESQETVQKARLPGESRVSAEELHNRIESTDLTDDLLKSFVSQPIALYKRNGPNDSTARPFQNLVFHGREKPMSIRQFTQAIAILGLFVCIPFAHAADLADHAACSQSEVKSGPAAAAAAAETNDGFSLISFLNAGPGGQDPKPTDPLPPGGTMPGHQPGGGVREAVQLKDGRLGASAVGLQHLRWEHLRELAVLVAIGAEHELAGPTLAGGL